MKDYLPLTQSMRIIFETADQLPGHLVEAAVDAFLVTDDLSSSNEAVTKEELVMTVSPNPFTDNFTITLPSALINDQRNFKIFDIFGRQLYTLTTNDPQFEVNLSHLPNGLYLVQVYEQQQLKTTQKLFKQ
ncbi:MAG: T9SS type A sorting domain-containing protein [Saprospiraceae bacterium]|nr:T9SS type A sorting domain-containing protein [Saprospiraceae bacterium]